jgi:hypothetical protein
MDPLAQAFAQGCKTFVERMFDWGPFFILAVLMLYGLYRLVRGVGMKVVGAMEKPAEALNKQAQSMDKLTNSIQEYVGRDQTEHKEIILLLKVVASKINRIEEAQNEAKDGS